MKPKGLFVVSGAVLVIALAAYILWTIKQGVDSPITVADGSITFSRQNGKKFYHDAQSDKHHWLNDGGFAATFIEVAGCPAAQGCSSDNSYNLNNVDNWVLTLNDLTMVMQDTKNTNKFDIQLNSSPSTSSDQMITESDPHLLSAVLTLGVGGNTVQNLTCPTAGTGLPRCQIIIHYRNPK